MDLNIKESTLEKRVNYLLKLDLRRLDLGKVVNNKTQYHKQLKDLHKRLLEFDRQLNAIEDEYVKEHERDNAFDLFSRLTDALNGDSDKARLVLNDMIDRANTHNKQADEVNKTETESNDSNNVDYSDPSLK